MNSLQQTCTNTSALLCTQETPLIPHTFSPSRGNLLYLALDSSHNGQTHAESGLWYGISQSTCIKKVHLLLLQSLYFEQTPACDNILVQRQRWEEEEVTQRHTADSRVIWFKPRRVCLLFTNAGAQLELRDQWTGPRRVDLASLHSNQGLFIYAQAGL